MPLRLVWYILILICIFTFIGLNLGNSSDINLWFTESAKLKDIPIFISFFVMYILGAISVLPYVIGSGLKKKKLMKQLKRDNSLVPEKMDKKTKRMLKRKIENNSESDSENSNSL
ncbi:hypothetical protein [Oceanispirochaeta sp.]|jgi:uncharacterized integral membrane protein|uniref:hypothetical protein n=1 Tax=Oceanispirochaeta sp. TaxID=2035350 RepID=UPI00260F8253|nr:hypothetical protein [Oceanispirochaeta sp.]MDA3956898.1 hypothetical protein [Oceanispirochaeta sp.]